jgi:hypothetical protein
LSFPFVCPPPGGSRLRPTNAIGASRYQSPSSPIVSATHIPSDGAGCPAELGAGLKVVRTKDTYFLACLQAHWSMVQKDPLNGTIIDRWYCGSSSLKGLVRT